MYIRTRLAGLFFIAFGFIAQLQAQSNNETIPESLEERITLVENSLSPLVAEAGGPLWNLEERLKTHNLPGLSLAVIHDFKIDWAKAYGKTNNESGQEVTTETVFQAASISKFVNGVTWLKWRESSGIDLDVDVNSLLSTWQIEYTKGQPITVRQLLSHTAGLSTHGFGGYNNADNLPTLVEILNSEGPANSQRVRTIMAPGEAFKYSGGGTTITQLILTENSETPYEELVQQLVLDPLEMNHSFYSISLDRYTPNMAYGHNQKAKPLKSKYHYYPESAAAGLWTTPSDLAHLIIDVQTSLKGGEAKVLSGESSTELIQPTLEDAFSALGVFIEENPGEAYAQHSGSNEGFRGKFYFGTQSGNGVVVLVNGPNTEIIEEIIRSVAAVYQWPGMEPLAANTDLNLSSEDLKKYTGIFSFKGREIIVSMKKGKLKVAEKGKWSSSLTPLDRSKFVFDGVRPQATIEFISDDAEEIMSCLLVQGEQSEWVKK